jgi:hypothetical protein
MARPPMPLGSYNSINTREVKTKSGEVRWLAQAYIRDLDGKRRRVERWGLRAEGQARTPESAERAASAHGSDGLKPSSRFREAAAIWLAGVERTRRGSTIDNYRQRLNALILPALGELHLREVSVGVLDRFMDTLEDRGLSVSTRRNQN